MIIKPINICLIVNIKSGYLSSEISYVNSLIDRLTIIPNEKN